jgi:Xaa-Pro aminopeptidase
MSDRYQRRLGTLREALGAVGADALFVTPGPDFLYLTGLSVYAGERLLALVAPREGEAFVVAPVMNREQVTGLAGVSEVVLWSDTEGYVSPAAGALAKAGLGRARIAVDDEMRAQFLREMQEACPEIEWQGAGAVMRRLRIRKDAEEVERMARAAAVADAAIPVARAACRPGRTPVGEPTEEAVAAEVRAAMESGTPGASVYDVIVASGPNSALPHHHTGARVLERGDIVILDYGCALAGYHSDITLTLSLGPPDEERKRVYRTVWEAQQRAIEAIRPGVPAEEVDRAARDVIEAAGYGEAFLHRTGHGIGLQVHEAPNLVAGNREPLEEGFCFSVEPGIYLAGRFGIRLEVIVAVTADGVRLLNAPSSPTFVDVLNGGASR